jgi:hypothetical protein
MPIFMVRTDEGEDVQIAAGWYQVSGEPPVVSFYSSDAAKPNTDPIFLVATVNLAHLIRVTKDSPPP